MTEHAGDFNYDTRRPAYEVHRQADPRIAALVHAGLADAHRVLNVGAGAGSYEPTDRSVIAVEPSALMRAKRPVGAAPVADAVAEALPFADATFDAAMAMITVHQWRERDRGLAELRRVTRGPVVVLTFDADVLDRFWLADYAPELIEAERHRYPDPAAIARALGTDTAVTSVPVPIDCTDGFTEAFYARPDRFLDPGVRAAQSAWGFVPPEAQARAVAHLTADLESGEWERRHGHLRTEPTFAGSLRLIVARP